MANFRLFVLVFVFVGASKMSDAVEELATSAHRTLPTLSISKIKGRLLTPEEGCGFSNVTNTKIVGGQNAKIGAWPWIALLAYWKPVGFTFGCGGTLITSRHVLSAGHCINLDLGFVRLGVHDTSTDPDGSNQDVNVVRRARPGFFSVDRKYDIGIVYLEHDVDFTDRIRPVCLPVNEPNRWKSFVGSNPFVAGWGTLRENGTEMTNILQQVQVPVVENIECKKAFREKGELHSNQQFTKGVLCAGRLAGGEDSCKGDSGGPLMLPHFENGSFPFYQIGIVSYGLGCGHLPSVYTDVAYFAKWIEYKIKN